MKRIVLVLGLIGLMLFGAELAARDEVDSELELSPAYSKLTQSIYYIYKDESRMSGGTGFAITVPNGPTTIVSNAHVCGDNLYVYLGQDKTTKLKKARVLRKDPVHDLCEIETPKGISPLTLAVIPPKQFDTIIVIGHPYLDPISPSPGIILTMRELFIEQRGTNCGFENEVLKNNSEGSCLVSHHGYFSNALVMPGNSGSPVFNTSGEVIGVAFISGPAGSLIITLEDLTRFLKDSKLL